MIRIKLKEIFHSSAKLIASDSDIDEAFKFMHQSIMRKIKNYACKNLIDIDIIIKHSIKILSVSARRINSIKRWR